jgi:hypothetical protein
MPYVEDDLRVFPQQTNSLLDKLKLPKHLHDTALELLQQIETATTVDDLKRYYHRADGFAYGLSKGLLIDDTATGYLWMLFERAQLDKMTQIKERLIV